MSETDTSSTQYSTDALGNLIGLAPGSPFISNQGDIIATNPDGSISITPAIDNLIPSLPWYAWAGVGVIGVLLIRALVR